jgi:putative adhesin
MRRICMPLLTLAVLTVVSVPARAVDEVFSKSYHLDSNGSFELQNVNGSVEIMGWDRDTVEVYAVKSAKSALADLSRVQIDVASAPDHLSVATRYPQEKSVEVAVEYHIRVPRHARLTQIGTVNGAVRASHMETTGALHSVNGNVEILDSAGGFSTHTTNGNLRLELLRLEPGEPVDAVTVNGSIQVALEPNAGAALDVRTLNGDFRSDLPVYVQSAIGSRRFRGLLGHGGTQVTLRTVNGTIRILALNPNV